MNVVEKVSAASLRLATAASVGAVVSPKWQRMLTVFAVIGLVMVLPTQAHAAPWDTTAENVYNLLMSIARWVAIIGIVACGLAAIFGKLSWEWAGKIIIGLVLIFGGTQLVDYFSNGM